MTSSNTSSAEELVLRALLAEARQQYLVQMENLYHKKTSNSVLMGQLEYKAKLDRLLELEADPQAPKRNTDYRLLKMYEVRLVAPVPELQLPDGVARPRLCKRGVPDGGPLPYMPFEELFDVLHSAHIQLKHAGRNSLQRFFRNKYANITKDCIMAYLATCKNCPRPKRLPTLMAAHHRKWLHNVKAEEDDDDDFVSVGDATAGGGGTASEMGSMVEQSPRCSSPANSMTAGAPAVAAGMQARVMSTAPLQMHALQQLFGAPTRMHAPRTGAALKRAHTTAPSVEAFTRGQVDLFDMQAEPDGDYRFVLRYTNLGTHECRLRPLRSGSAWECADALVDVYCEQGAPAVLQSLNGREFAEEVIAEVFKLWPRCRQLHAAYAPALRSLQGATADSIQRAFLARVRDCTQRLQLGGWTRALRHLQWELNTTYCPEIQRSPIEGALGKVPTVGLRSSKLLDAIYDKARSEELIMEYLQDAELLRLSAFCYPSVTQSTAPTPSSSATAVVVMSPGNPPGCSTSFGHSFGTNATSSRCSSPPMEKKLRLSSSSSSSASSTISQRSAAAMALAATRRHATPQLAQPHHQQQLVVMEQPYNSLQQQQSQQVAVQHQQPPMNNNPHSQSTSSSVYHCGPPTGGATGGSATSSMYQPSPSPALPLSIPTPAGSVVSNASVGMVNMGGGVAPPQQPAQLEQHARPQQMGDEQVVGLEMEQQQQQPQHHHQPVQMKLGVNSPSLDVLMGMGGGQPPHQHHSQQLPPQEMLHHEVQPPPQQQQPPPHQHAAQQHVEHVVHQHQHDQQQQQHVHHHHHQTMQHQPQHNQAQLDQSGISMLHQQQAQQPQQQAQHVHLQPQQQPRISADQFVESILLNAGSTPHNTPTPTTPTAPLQVMAPPSTQQQQIVLQHHQVLHQQQQPAAGRYIDYVVQQQQQQPQEAEEQHSTAGNNENAQLQQHEYLVQQQQQIRKHSQQDQNGNGINMVDSQLQHQQHHHHHNNQQHYIPVVPSQPQHPQPIYHQPPQQHHFVVQQQQPQTNNSGLGESRRATEEDENDDDDDEEVDELMRRNSGCVAGAQLPQQPQHVVVHHVHSTIPLNGSGQNGGVEGEMCNPGEVIAPQHYHPPQQQHPQAQPQYQMQHPPQPQHHQQPLQQHDPQLQHLPQPHHQQPPQPQHHPQHRRASMDQGLPPP